MRKYICILMAFMLLVSTFAYAQELTKREDYSEDYYAVYHYATTQDQEEDLPFETIIMNRPCNHRFFTKPRRRNFTYRRLNDKGQFEG